MKIRTHLAATLAALLALGPGCAQPAARGDDPAGEHSGDPAGDLVGDSGRAPMRAASEDAPAASDAAVEQGDGPDALDPDVWFRAETEGGGHVVAWRVVDGRVRRNEELELELRVFGPSVEVLGAVAVRGWMPAHSHGFVRQPQITPMGAGRFRVEGFLLHMRGAWQVFVDVPGPDGVEVARFELDLR